MSKPLTLIGFAVVLAFIGGAAFAVAAPLGVIVWAAAGAMAQVGVIALGVSLGMQDYREKDAVRQG